MFLPHVKICGITRRQDALFCAEAGAGALGAVFYEKSPRNVSPAQARELFKDLPLQIARVGVFVNASVETMLKTARAAGLDSVQMHGEETAEKIEAVRREGFHVIQAIKRTGPELLAAARALPLQVDILVECGRGALPGGNGLA
ncbi:MAG TPA: phosphoribosylanthranilate isomerase, partial [Verrucomicrobia bacterium]|nr:phosphoribosylanthranilate isomerase [Verrucomicrobiota bacterium]